MALNFKKSFKLSLFFVWAFEVLMWPSLNVYQFTFELFTRQCCLCFILISTSHFPMVAAKVSPNVRNRKMAQFYHHTNIGGFLLLSVECGKCHIIRLPSTPIELYCPENKADFWNYRRGSPLAGKFPNNPRKWCLVSENYFRKSALFLGQCTSAANGNWKEQLS
jgi:hypothetical protein